MIDGVIEKTVVQGGSLKRTKNGLGYTDEPKPMQAIAEEKPMILQDGDKSDD